MRRILLPVFLLLACLPALSQTTCQELIPKIMEAAGINQSFAALPDQLRHSADSLIDKEGAYSVDSEVAVRKVYEHAFDVDRMEKNFRSKLMASCEPVLYRQALEQMHSPLAQKISALEVRAGSNADERLRMERFIASFPMQSPRESRMRLIQNLLSTMGTAEQLANLSVSMGVEMSEAMDERLNPAEVEEQKAELKGRIEESMEGGMFYSLRPLSDEELQQYIAMEASKPTQRLNQDMARAYVNAARLEAADLALKLKPVFQEQKAKFGK